MEGSEGTAVVSEVPETLKNLCLLLTKKFYGTNHYVLLDYVQRLGCVKEDRLRDVLKMDPRHMRTLIVTLKVDKFLKERTIAEENDGRSRKVNYYHVNYKAILNVTKYKIDHMRQKLEHKEQSHVQQASYVCSNQNCKRHFEAMDIMKIMDMETNQMICWQCQGVVVADETAGPSEQTRTSMAKFNDDMAGIFSMLQQLDGIRFARHILEPPITITRDEPSEGDRQAALQVGARMFSNAEKTRSDLYANGIMVSIGERQEVQVESKEKVPWLQHLVNEDAGPSGIEDPTNGISGISLDEVQESVEPSILAPLLGDAATADIGTLIHQAEGTKEHSEAFSPTRSLQHKESVDENGLHKNGDSGMETQGSTEEDFVMVQGVLVSLEDIDQDAVSRMTSAERQAYVDFVSSSVFF